MHKKRYGIFESFANSVFLNALLFFLLSFLFLVLTFFVLSNRSAHWDYYVTGILQHQQHTVLDYIMKAFSWLGRVRIAFFAICSASLLFLISGRKSACFALQGLGALIEPIVIPHIPKRLGGGKLWTICFLLVTVPFFSNQVSKPARLFSIFTPLDQWNILHLFVPIVFAPVCL